VKPPVGAGPLAAMQGAATLACCLRTCIRRWSTGSGHLCATPCRGEDCCSQAPLSQDAGQHPRGDLSQSATRVLAAVRGPGSRRPAGTTGAQCRPWRSPWERRRSRGRACAPCGPAVPGGRRAFQMRYRRTPGRGETPLPQVGIGARLRLVCPGLRLSGAVPTPGAAIALPISTGSG
jgi:hypothetical protein